MPSITFNNTMLTGMWNIVPAIKGAVFSVSQYARMAKGATADFYGMSVASTATELAVGANGTTAGSVYLYTRNGDDWNDLATITGPSNNKIGQAVDITSEWLAVSGVASTATVYLYRKVNGVWGTSPFQTITTSDSGINFGWSLSLSGNSLAIGHREGNSANGAVQIWVFDGNTWNKQTTITPPAGAILVSGSQRIGFSVHLVGDTLVAGGPAAAAGTGNGSAIVSTRTGTTWSTPAVLLPSGSTSGTGFGTSVLINNASIFVGAANQNAVYQFTKAGSTWTQAAKMDVSGTGTIADSGVGSARVGWSITANSTGTVIAAGGYLYNSQAGAVYVFENVNGTWGPSAINNGGFSRLLPSPAVTSGRFGWAQTMSNNLLMVTGTGNGSNAPGYTYTFK